MNFLKTLKFYIASIGFVIVLIVSLLSLFGYDIKINGIIAMFVSIGALILCIPAIIQIKNIQQNKSLINNTKEFYEIAFADKPKFFSKIVRAIGFYALVTFIIGFIYLKEGSAEIENGNYILQNKGKFIRTITETEYHFLNAKATCLGTGVLLFFYAFATGFYYPTKK